MAQRLPTPGGDDGDWGNILNGFLTVSLNGDGTLQTTALTQAGGEVTSNKGIASGYAPLNSSSLVPTTNLGTGSASSSNYLRGDGSWVAPNGGSSSLASDSDVTITSPANDQVLTYDSTTGKWINQAAPTASNATSSTPGLIQLDGDLGGSATSPTVAKINGISISNTPAGVGKRFISTSSTTTAWQQGPTFPVDAFGADPTGATASDNAVAAAMMAMGNNPGEIEFGAGTYKLNSPMATLGPGQGILGSGRLATTINFYGTGDCIRAYDPRAWGSGGPGTGGVFKGFTIDGTNAGANSSGIHYGDMQSGRIENITIQNFGQSGSIGLWLNNVVTWAERSDIEIVANLNTNAVVFNNSSFDYSTYKFVLSANSNQNGVVIENGAQLYGTDMTIRGNFGTGTANTGTVLTIGTTSSDGSQLGASHLLCQVETNGTTGLGHTTITIGAAAAFSGNGILNFISGNGTSFQSGNAGNRVAFSGYINVDSSMGTMAYWQGLRSIGPSTTNPGYMSPTGDIFPSNIILQQLTAGAQTITFDPGTQASLAGQAMTIDLLLQQPASGDTTLTWPSSVQWTTGNPPVLSTTANAVDHIRLTTPDFVTYFGEQLNITYPGGIRTTTGAPVSASTDQVGEFAWDNSSHTIYGPLASPVPAVGQPWNSTAVRLALATAPSFAQTGTPVYGYSSPPSATLPSCTAGNTLVLWITKSTATATTVSGGPSGVTWTKAASAYDNTNGGACEIWLGTGYSTSSSTISPTITASGNFIGSVGLDESTGIPASSAVDTQYATLASGNIAQIITTDEPNDLVISVVNNMSGNTLSNPSLTNSWISDNLGMSWGLLASPTTVGTVTWTSQTGTDHTVMATLTLLSE